jgi:hypothetical protein
MPSAWMDRAACAAYVPEPGEPWPWDTDRLRSRRARQAVRQQTQLARMICATCPVRKACLAYGMELDYQTGLPEGTWGGESPEDRARLLGGSIKWISGIRRLQYED